MWLLFLQLLFLPETFADIGNAAERRLVLGRELIFVFGAGRGVIRPASGNAHLVDQRSGRRFVSQKMQAYTGCQKGLPKGRAQKRRFQGVMRTWINILGRRTTQEPGFPRRNRNSFFPRSGKNSNPQLSRFGNIFWQSVYVYGG